MVGHLLEAKDNLYALTGTTIDNVRNFLPMLLSRVHVEVFSFGNITAKVLPDLSLTRCIY